MIILGFVVAGTVFCGFVKACYNIISRKNDHMTDDYKSDCQVDLYNVKSYEGWLITKKVKGRVHIVGLPELMSYQEAKNEYEDIAFTWDSPCSTPQMSFVRIGQKDELLDTFIKDSTILVSDWKSALKEYEDAHNRFQEVKSSVNTLVKNAVLLDASTVYLEDELKWHEQTLVQKKNDYEIIEDKVDKLRQECFTMISKLQNLYDDALFPYDCEEHFVEESESEEDNKEGTEEDNEIQSGSLSSSSSSSSLSSSDKDIPHLVIEKDNDDEYNFVH